MEKMKNFGIAIRELRESKDLTLEEASNFCKIKKVYLEKFEKGNFSFKSEIYIKLFLRAYMDYVDLEKSDSIMQEFDNLFNVSSTKPELTFVPAPSAKDKSNKNAFEIDNYNPKKIARIIFIIILIIIIYQFIIHYFLVAK